MESFQKLPAMHEERIMDICAIPHLKNMAAASLDKKIVFYDLASLSVT